MKKIILALALSVVVSAAAFAQSGTPFEVAPPPDGTGGGGSTGGPTGDYTQPNLSYHGGSKLQYAKLVYIFWGFSWTGAPGSGEYTSELVGFRKAGMPNHLSMLNQYNAPQSASQLNYGYQADVWDPVGPPPGDISDFQVQQEILKYFHNQIDPWTIYTVVLPLGTYPINPLGGRTCGGGAYGNSCAYHYKFIDHQTYGDAHGHYAVIPWPECEGCHPPGFSDAMASEVHIIHEAREVMTDPELNAWYDSNGQEADDKCAYARSASNVFVNYAPVGAPYYNAIWSFGFQKEWSNAVHGCVE
jgi:hypothetical protein